MQKPLQIFSRTWLPSKNDSEMLLNANSYCTSPSPHDYIHTHTQSWKVLKLSSLREKVQGW